MRRFQPPETAAYLEFGGGNRTRLQEAQAPEKKEVFGLISCPGVVPRNPVTSCSALQRRQAVMRLKQWIDLVPGLI